MKLRTLRQFLLKITWLASAKGNPGFIVVNEKGTENTAKTS